MNLYEAIFYRKSIRKYKPVALSHETLKNIENVINETKRLYAEIKMDIHIVEDGKKIQEISKGIVGSYGKILAPHYFVITSEEKEGFQENVGYTLEQIVLTLTTMGIGTCWIGGYIKKELLNGVIEIPENQKPIIVISFGIPLDDHLNKEISIGNKRKNIESIVLNQYDSGLKDIVEAMRRAPSATNLQPWRLFFEENNINIYLEEGNFLVKKIYHFKNLDGGIALAHLKVACEQFGIKVNFEKRFQEKKGLDYLITAVLEK
ncbi:MAG: nitroreductase family protein [Clostridiaceae bacterium]